MAVSAEPPPQSGGELVVDKFIASAQAKAAKDGERVEIPQHRTESSTIYANPDGKTLRMELYTEPIRMKKPDGEGFIPIDTTLVKRDGVITPKAVPGKLTLSAGGERTLLRSDSDRLAASVSAPAKLPKPQLDGNTATYRSAFGEDVDLQVTATTTGFRQKIIIRSRPTGPLRFRLPVDLPEGMSFRADAAGQVSLMSGDKKILDLRPGMMLDAVAEAPDAPIDGGRLGRAQVTLEPGTSTLVYTPDPDFLADPTVTYPVTVMAVDSDWWEPDISDGGSDTFINNAEWKHSADGFNLDRILVGKSNSGTVTWRSYLKFPDIPKDSPLRQGTVQNADLILWNHLSNSCGDAVGSGIIARRITSPWDELTLHWNSQPTVTNAGADVELGAYSPDCKLGGWAAKEWYLIHSVNGIVQEWADGAPNYGIQLAATNESDLTNWRRYRTQEYTCCSPGAHPPKLTVDFEPGQRLRVVFGFDERPSGLPTYDEAAANAIEPGDEGLPPMPVAASIAHDDAPGVAYEVRAENLKPLDGGEWSAMDPDVGDDVPPAVESVSPAADATGVPVDQRITVTFSEPVEGAVFTLKTAAGVTVTGTTEMNEDKTRLTFTPGAPLAEGTVYTAEVADAEDLFENVLETYTWSFTTVDGGVRGRWNFDEGEGRTAADSSGRGNDATLTDTAGWTTGKTGSAVSNTRTEAFAAARAEAVRQGRRVEVAGATTATSVTYAEPDGKHFTTTITSGPTRTRVNGRWVPIDTSLVQRGDVLQPKAIASGVGLEVSRGGSSPFVTMTANGHRYALRWPSPLPEPTVDGNVATFADAAGDGADLVVTVLPTGFRHDVLLRKRPAKPLELRIGVENTGLRLAEGRGGRLLLTGKKGKVVASAPRPVMWDGRAKGRRQLARDHMVDADVVERNGRTELVLKPDHAWLSDPKTVYPVRVDPSITLPIHADVEIDSSTDEDWPGDPTGAFLMAGTQTGNQKYRVHLRFDTAGLSGSTVTSAKLTLNNIDAPGCGTAVGAGIQVRRLTSDWDPDNLHWGNKPTSTTEDAHTVTKAVNQECDTWPGLLEWNVTGIVQDWAAGAPNHGLVLQSPTETNTDNYRVFTSADDTEFGVPPTLTVTTSGPASAPAIGGLGISPAEQVDGATVTRSLTPQLAGTVSDPAGGDLTAQFEVEHDPAATEQGSGQIWTGTSGTVASGGQATVTVPAGRLQDGWRIRWRARAANAGAGTASDWSAWQTATVDVPNPTVGSLQVTPSLVVDGRTVTTSLTPDLRATVTDPDGQALRAEFEVEHDPAVPDQGSGRIWAGAVDDVASGSVATLALPAGTLADGWRIRWRARAVNQATTVASPWSSWQDLTVDLPDPEPEPAVIGLRVDPSRQVDGGTVTTSLTPALVARVSNTVGGTLRAEFEVEHDPAVPDQGSGRIWAGAVDDVASGEEGSVSVPAGVLTDGWKIRWRARAVAGELSSAWTDWQHVTVEVPKPTVAEPALTPVRVVDGTLVSGTLTPLLTARVSDPGGQALRAEFEVEHDPAVPDQGSGRIWAGAVDDVASGTVATLAVPAGTLADGWRIRWRARAVAGELSSAWTDWQHVTIDVVHPGEEPLAVTDEAVIRTDDSFTAAAWLRWDDKEGDYQVLEQRGTNRAPFRLGNTPEHGLVFTLADGDTAEAATAGVLSGVEPPVGEWFHLAGVYDAAADTVTLYLNGTAIGSASIGFEPWHAESAMTLGTRMLGDLDEVRVYQRALSAQAVAELLAEPAVQQAPAAKKADEKTEADPETTAKVAAAALPGFDYERHDLKECNDKLRPSGLVYTAEGFRELKPYSGCWTKWLGWGEWDVDRKKSVAAGRPIPVPDPDDAVVAEATVVMHTYLGNADGTAVIGGGSHNPRDISVWVEIKDVRAFDDGEPTTKFDNDYLRLEVTADEGEDSGDCVRRRSDTDRRARIGTWRAGTTYEDYVFTSLPKAGDDASIDICEISPKLIYEDRWGPIDGEIALWNKPERRIYRYSQVPRVRCDSSKMGNKVGKDDYRHKGACVFGSANRIFTMSRSDKNITGAVMHNFTALNHPEATIPQLRDGNGNLVVKKIPGDYGPGVEPKDKNNFLRRGTASPSAAAKEFVRGNRDTIATPCRQERKRLEDQGVKVKGTLQCDEYPYASTKQGAKYANGHYSIRYIPKLENNLHGRYLSAFYSRYRVGTDNKFWVRIVD